YRSERHAHLSACGSECNRGSARHAGSAVSNNIRSQHRISEGVRRLPRWKTVSAASAGPWHAVGDTNHCSDQLAQIDREKMNLIHADVTSCNLMIPVDFFSAIS